MSSDMEVESNFFSLPFIFHERINIMDYPSNAGMGQQAPKQPEKVESVISSTPKVKARTAKGLKGIIFSQDFRDIKDGVYEDIVKPKIKEFVYAAINNISETINSSLQMMIFGDVRQRSSNYGLRRPGDKVSYNQYSSSKPPTPTMTVAYDCSDLTYDSRGDAEIVLASMRDHLYQYPYVTVAQMYEFSNLKSPSYTSTNYGWDNLDGVQVKRTLEGDYVIDLPRAKALPR